MNQWKRDLDGIVGDVSEQKKRLADGVAKKLYRKKKNRKPVFAFVVALLTVAFSLFLLSEKVQVKEQQADYLGKKAVYFDEQLFLYFQSMNIYGSKMNNDIYAFNQMMDFQAYEQFAYENGYVLDQVALSEMKELIRQNYEDYKNDEEVIARMGRITDYLNMDKTSYIQTALLPVVARQNLMYDWLTAKEAKFSADQLESISSNFLVKYAAEIAKIKEQYNIPVDTYDFSMYAKFKGMVIAYDKEQERILVVTGATHEDILMLTSTQIIEKYENGVWFTIDKLPPRLTVGDVVQVSYEFVEEALPAQSEAKHVKITVDYSCENTQEFSCLGEDKELTDVYDSGYFGLYKPGIRLFGPNKGLTGFHKSGYSSKYNNHFIVWGEDGLHINGYYNSGVHGRQNDLDMIMELEGAKEGDFFKKVYENAKIVKEENQYIVKLTDELSLTFDIIGPRTIKDTKGVEYTTQMYLEE